MSSVDPSGFLHERPSGAGPWRWRLLDSSGEEARASGAADATTPRFPSQSEAETWLGEEWRTLLEGGVESVVLLDGDREVYGPMRLRP